MWPATVTPAVRRPYRMSVLKTLASGWHATVHVVVGLPVALLTGILVQNVGLLALIVAVVWPLARPARDAVFTVARACTHWQSSRFRHLIGVELIPAPQGNVAAGWRQVFYHAVVSLMSSLVASVALLTMWAAAVVCFLLPVFSRPGATRFGLRLWDPVVLTALVLVAALLVLAAIRLAPVLATLDTYLARAMLQASRAEQLASRVQALHDSRAEVVDAADAERRRIERDLHDGAQQRLVSLAMNLGLARANLSTMDAEAREVIEHAHDEAKLALAELRELVRGLHPAVLNDRGLDAALSGIAARSPVPARLTVDVPVRPSATVEAVAYFVVSETLSNVAKHARASSVDISVVRQGVKLLVTIRDDGAGGADPAVGTGLRGLAQRVASVDGTLHLSSPAGGPTVITVELPCET